MQNYDVIVVGGGPSGSSCTTFLAREGLKVLMLDKAKFPRDKACGDGISGKCLKALRELGVLEQLRLADSRPIHGILISSPEGRRAYLEPSASSPTNYPGFVCKRFDFDAVLFEHASKHAEVKTGMKVKDLLRDGSQVVGVVAVDSSGVEHNFRANVVVGADGFTSVVAKKLGVLHPSDKHTATSVRAYYSGISDLSDDIELHFLDEFFPGYMWIFPLPDNRANVGIGVRIEDLKKGKMNLTKMLNTLLKEHPLFSKRFANATREGDINGWSLPFGSRISKMSFDGALLLGDAACLVDPFTGEGIGNALASARIAAKVLTQVLKQTSRPTQGDLLPYEKNVHSFLGPELRASYALQKLTRSRFFMNMLVRRLGKSRALQEYVAATLFNEDPVTIGLSPRLVLNALLPIRI